MSSNLVAPKPYCRLQFPGKLKNVDSQAPPNFLNYKVQVAGPRTSINKPAMMIWMAGWVEEPDPLVPLKGQDTWQLSAQHDRVSRAFSPLMCLTQPVTLALHVVAHQPSSFSDQTY